MKVLITGGLGFIGANLVERFLKRDWEVAVIDSMMGVSAKENIKLPFMDEVELHKCDLIAISMFTLTRMLEDVDLIIHCAADVRKGVEYPFLTLRSNTYSTLALCEAVAKSRNPFVPIFYTSSGLVYGNAGFEAASEETPVKPNNPYNVSKLAGEYYLRAYKEMYNLKFVIFRLSNVYGRYVWPTQEQGLVPLIIATALRGETFQFFRPHNGYQVRDFTHVSGVLDAIDLAYEKRIAVQGMTFNIGDGIRSAITIRGLVEMISELMGVPIKTEVGALLRGDVPCYYADWSRAKGWLGWYPRVGLEEGLRDTIEWVKEVVK